MSPSINVSDEGPVRVLTIDNPAKRNAFSGDMAPTLRDRLEEADEDTSVRAVVITGAGGESFSSGHDLQEVLRDPVTAGDPVANAGFTMPSCINTPVIGAVNGPAYAAGFILALNCDLRVAGRTARFCAVGAKIGLVPVGGQLSRLLSVVPYPVAFKWLATAAPFTAEEAERSGFVTEVCEPEHTLDRALALARTIAQVSPSVVQAVKAGLATTLSRGLDAGLTAETELAALVRELPDGGEGVNSFLDKRPAVYPDSPASLRERIAKVVR